MSQRAAENLLNPAISYASSIIISESLVHSKVDIWTEHTRRVLIHHIHYHMNAARLIVFTKLESCPSSNWHGFVVIAVTSWAWILARAFWRDLEKMETALHICVIVFILHHFPYQIYPFQQWTLLWLKPWFWRCRIIDASPRVAYLCFAWLLRPLTTHLQRDFDRYCRFRVNSKRVTRTFG